MAKYNISAPNGAVNIEDVTHNHNHNANVPHLPSSISHNHNHYHLPSYISQSATPTPTHQKSPMPLYTTSSSDHTAIPTVPTRAQVQAITAFTRWVQHPEHNDILLRDVMSAISNKTLTSTRLNISYL
eukprot:1162546_1